MLNFSAGNLKWGQYYNYIYLTEKIYYNRDFKDCKDFKRSIKISNDFKRFKKNSEHFKDYKRYQQGYVSFKGLFL